MWWASSPTFRTDDQLQLASRYCYKEQRKGETPQFNSGSIQLIFKFDSTSGTRIPLASIPGSSIRSVGKDNQLCGSNQYKLIGWFVCSWQVEHLTQQEKKKTTREAKTTSQQPFFKPFEGRLNWLVVTNTNWEWAQHKVVIAGVKFFFFFFALPGAAGELEASRWRNKNNNNISNQQLMVPLSPTCLCTANTETTWERFQKLIYDKVLNSCNYLLR